MSQRTVYAYVRAIVLYSGSQLGNGLSVDQTTRGLRRKGLTLLVLDSSEGTSSLLVYFSIPALVYKHCSNLAEQS
eukprot:7342823-Pyramimonas_sp.AAC.1